MMQHSDSNSIQLDLIALADGELDAAGIKRVEQFLKQHEQTASGSAADTQTSDENSVSASEALPSKAMSHDLGHIRAMLMKLRVKQAVQASTPAVSAALQNQIAQMFTDNASGLAASSAGITTTAAANTESSAAPLKFSDAPANNPWRVMSRWAPAAAAAMLLIGVSAVQYWQPGSSSNATYPDSFVAVPADNTDPSDSTSVFRKPLAPVASLTGQSNSNSRSTSTHDATANVTPAVLTTSLEAPVAYAQLSTDRINAFGQRHSMCSRKLERLYRSSEFPKEVAQMPEAIANALGQMPKGSLDLSKSGYQFSKAGKCGVPGQPSVHLVYRTRTADDSVSLWVATNSGRPQLAEGTLYQGDPADSEHPIFFFRQGELVYYLVGNAFDHTRTAAQSLVVASR